jgi:ribosomal protein S14
MPAAERAKIPAITNNNGRDYASCPRCGHYHAMMPDGVVAADGEHFRFLWCRDCRFNDVLVLATAAEAI